MDPYKDYFYSSDTDMLPNRTRTRMTVGLPLPPPPRRIPKSASSSKRISSRHDPLLFLHVFLGLVCMFVEAVRWRSDVV